MKINWKHLLIAAVWSEFGIAAIYVACQATRLCFPSNCFDELHCMDVSGADYGLRAESIPSFSCMERWLRYLPVLCVSS